MLRAAAISITLAITALVTTQATASLITFSDRANFQDIAGDLLWFEGFNEPPGFTGNVTVSSGNLFPRIDNTSGAESRATEGTGSLVFIETATNTFTFAAPVFAFGFDLIEINNVIPYVDSAGNTLNLPLAIGDNTAAVFFGVISDTLISSFTLGNGGPLNSGPLGWIDAFEARGEASSQVPAPATLALLGLGLGLLGLSLRRKA